MGSWLSPITFAALTACAIGRPEFVEPKWGDAPPPRPGEITELTWELRTCLRSCQYEQIVLRRDGGASHRFRTGNRLDSLFDAHIDSAAFARLTTFVVQDHFFMGRDDDGAHEPLATRSLVISAATLCRRRALSMGQAGPRSASGAAIDSASRQLRWTRCCRID